MGKAFDPGVFDREIVSLVVCLLWIVANLSDKGYLNLKCIIQIKCMCSVNVIINYPVKVYVNIAQSTLSKT